jgi:multidrug resistance efflux pump
VRAPADGYVTNLALRKGARVGTLPLSPVMAFIDTSETFIGAEVNQIDPRFIAPGQPVEITFKFLPGRIYRQGGVGSAGAVEGPGPGVAPFAVRVKLDDDRLTARLPAGSVGDAAIFAEHVKA